jgi:iron complex outermembrane recepter protein
VLRGPQGTLFGKNAVGGVIRLIPKKPTADPEATVEGTFGAYNRVDIRASFNTPLTENIYARFSFAAKKRDGFTRVVDYTCQMIANGTPQLAGIGDGIVGWNTTTNTPITGTVNSAADNAFALPRQTSPRGTDHGCDVDRMGDEAQIGGRAAFRFMINEQFEFNLTGDLTHQDQSGPPDWIQTLNPNLGLVNSYNRLVALPKWGVPYDTRFLTADKNVIYSTFEDPISGIKTPNITKLTNWGIHGVLDWTPSETFGAKLILAYRELDTEFGRDSDGSPLNVNHTLDVFDDEQYTAELRFNGQLFGGMTDWTVGGFYFHADDFNPNISILFPFPGFATGNIDRIDVQDTDNYAFFAHTVNRLTDQLTVTAGVRYTHDQKDILQTRVQRDGVTFLWTPTPDSVSANRVTPMINVAYQWTPDMMTYASWQRGFRGGGFNPRPTNVATLTDFGPEDLDSFELGFKGQMFDRRLRFNAAAFFMIYKDLQLPSLLVDSGGGVSSPPQNVGKAHLPGFEVEVQGRLTDSWTVEGALGYLGFTYKDLGKADPAFYISQGRTPPVSGQPCFGCRPIRAPEWTGNFGTTYKFDLGDTGSLALHGDMSYQSKVFFTADNNQAASQDGYALFNARATWENDARDLSLSLFVTNLTDERYAAGKLDFFTSLSTVQVSFGRPREWGISVKKRF